MKSVAFHCSSDQSISVHEYHMNPGLGHSQVFLAGQDKYMVFTKFFTRCLQGNLPGVLLGFPQVPNPRFLGFPMVPKGWWPPAMPGFYLGFDMVFTSSPRLQ
jgi:hypothetical protein